MSDKTVVVDKQGDGVAYIILNKPDRRNAIDAMMMDQLVRYLEELDADDSIRIIILKGEGDHFSSGGDLKAAPDKGYTIEESRTSLRKYLKAVQTIQQIETTVIAQVRGYAVGGGMSLALACDLIFAAESAKFSSNFLHVGIIPEMGAMLFMPLAIGLYRAKELWYTARVVEAKEAKEMGFVNRVFPDNEIDAETKAFAVEIAKVPTLSLGITKRITNSTMLTMLNTLLDAESQSSPFCSQTKEHKDLISAFINKKK